MPRIDTEVLNTLFFILYMYYVHKYCKLKISKVNASCVTSVKKNHFTIRSRYTYIKIKLAQINKYYKVTILKYMRRRRPNKNQRNLVKTFDPARNTYYRYTFYILKTGESRQ